MSITKTATGWKVDIRPYGAKGPRITKTFELKENALAHERQIFREKERLAVGGGSQMLATEALDKFELEMKSKRGYENSERHIIKIIKEYFTQDNKKISLLRLSDGKDFVTWVSNRKRTPQGGTERRPADDRPKSAGTINRYQHTLKRFMNWAVEMEYIAFSPFKKIKDTGAEIRARWLSVEEIQRLFGACLQVDSDLYDLVFFTVNTGFRLGNVQRFEYRDIGNGYVRALRTKSDKAYDVPTSPELKAFLAKIMPKEGPMFNFVNFERRWAKAVQLAGFSVDARDPYKVTFHTLRHTFAAHALIAGVPIYTVSQWLGHSSVKMTESVYAHVDKGHHEEEIKKFPSFLGGEKVETEKTFNLEVIDNQGRAVSSVG